MLTFACSCCGKSFTVPDEMAAKRISCDTCGEKLVVPGQALEGGKGILFRCGACRRLQKAAGELAGTMVRCVACGESSQVPGPQKAQQCDTPPREEISTPTLLGIILALLGVLLLIIAFIINTGCVRRVSQLTLAREAIWSFVHAGRGGDPF